MSEALRYLGSLNYAASSLDSYQASADRFLEFLDDHGLPDEPQQFTGRNVLRFAESLAAKKQKPSTIVIRLAALSSIANALMKLRDARDRPLLTQNPTKAFAWPMVDRPETKFLLPAELAAFLAAPRPLRESIARDIFVDTGLRCSELCRANVGDVLTVQGRTALAVTVKGRGRRIRKRHMPLSGPVATALYEYLLQRGIANPQDQAVRDQPLLLTSDGRRWARTGLSALMARIGQEAGITRLRVSAHKLRHTANVVARFARRADGTALDRWTRSQLLAHENSQSLDRYEHLLPDELFEAREAQRQALTGYVRSNDAAVDPPRAGDALKPLVSALRDCLHALEREVAARGSGVNGAATDHIGRLASGDPPPDAR